MRKIFALMVFVCLVGCSEGNSLVTPENKARKLVKEYISNNLGDPNSYEEIASSPADSIFYTPYYELAKKQYDELYNGLEKIYKEKWNSGLYIEATEVSEKQHKLVRAWLDSWDTLSYEHYGYGMLHKYRAANSLGGKDIYMLYFEFNKEIDSITSVDSLTMLDIYNIKEEIEREKDELDSMDNLEKADHKRMENILKAALN